MIITVSQAIYCNSTEDINNYFPIKKSYESTIVPRIGESLYIYMWNEKVESKIADVLYDMDKQSCDIMLEKRVTELSKENVAKLANLHGWETTI